MIHLYDKDAETLILFLFKAESNGLTIPEKAEEVFKEITYQLACNKHLAHPPLSYSNDKN